MGLIFVPYIHETLRKNFHRGVSGESTSEPHHRASSSTDSNSYQSLEDLVRIYDTNPRPDTPDIDARNATRRNSVGGDSESAGSSIPRTERAANLTFFPHRRPQTATPGSTAVSSIDRRTVRLFEVLSAYYVRSAYDRVRANISTLLPPPSATTTSGSNPEVTSSSNSTQTPPSDFTSRSIGLISTAQPAERDSDHDRAIRLARVFAAVRARSPHNSDDNAENTESTTARPQFIVRPDPNEVSSEELRLSNYHNGPLTFHSSSDTLPNPDPARPRFINLGPGLLRSPYRRPGEEDIEPLPPSFLTRGSLDQSSSSSSSSGDPSSSGSNLGRWYAPTNLDSESGESSSTPQAYLWHNETRTNITTHGCLRMIMRRYPGWEEQPAQNGFVEYLHYATVPRTESQGFELLRDAVARLPWPMLGMAGLETLRSFAYQINTIHHRDTPVSEYRGNIFDVILMPFYTTVAPPEDNRGSGSIQTKS
ncbi:hypothetical protein R1sor_025397 [Riccia sorocarpa]|uniref:Uncharacterized protein n=1 Tax=Riccia sorocarpa TaxID=122646 RepID=A0ABD3GAJ3_9MARC